MRGLKKCPFCGSAAEVVKTNGYFGYGVGYIVRCSSCGAHIPKMNVGFYYNVKNLPGKNYGLLDNQIFRDDCNIIDTLAETWNTRAESI